MLVLSRKVGEEIVLTDEITIKVCYSKDGRVGIGIQAPSHIRIFRKEIYDLIKEEEKCAESAKAGASTNTQQ